MAEPEEQKGAADQDKKNKKNKAPKAAKEVSSMQAGDYTLHLLIQKAKDLEIDSEDAMNVQVEVQVQTFKEFSKELKDVTATTVCNFDSHIFIELMGQSVAQLQQSKILIKLQTKGFFKSDLIGQVELDLTYIYNMEGHTKEHQWFALINPDSEDFSSVSAYIKMSGSVYGVSDTPKELKMDDNDDDEDCVMPASMKPTYTQLKMHIVKAEHLPKLDTKMIGEGTMDAFVQAKIGAKKIRTSVQKTEKDEATWNQTLLIPVRMPIMSGKLVIGVWDLDSVNDEQAGALIFDYHDLLSREQKSFFWANIYGAPGQEEVKLIDTNSDVADEMNQDPTKATKWKGRILIGIEHEVSETPKLGLEDMSNEHPKDKEGDEIPGAKSIVELAQDYIEQGRGIKYKLMYEFSSCINTPKKLGKYNLQLAIAEHHWNSDGSEKKRAVGYNYNRWNQRSEGEIEFEVPYGELADIGDIFLYLCPDKGGLGGIFGGGGDKVKEVGKPISYIKLRAEDYEDPNPDLQWVELKEELVEDKLDSPELAGVVGFRLSITRADSGLELQTQPQWKKRLPRRPDSTKIRCYLFQCKDLPAADEDGASDPKVIVYNTVDADSNEKRMLSQVCQTKCVENNCDPMFYELLELKLDYNDEKELPPFIFDVYDVDKKFIGDDDMDYIGRACITIKPEDLLTITEDEDSVNLKPLVPKWYPIRYEVGSPKAGEILCSFIRTKEFDHDWRLPNSEVTMMGMYDEKAQAQIAEFEQLQLTQSQVGGKIPKTPKGTIIPVQPVVLFDEFRVELNVLGLRGLKSPGLLPVQKAYIEFLTKSMVPPIAASALESISTQSGPSGSDPTINSVISFSVPMPCDDLYAPSMACRVFDKVFKGFSGQLIGTFTIPVGQIMRDHKEDYAENCKMLDDVIKQLEDVLEEKAVVDYEPVNKNVDSKLIEDKKFREDQRKQKAQIAKAMATKPKEEKKTLTDKIADKLAPEPVKPTKALAKKLEENKSNSLKKRLILNTDDDTDSDGEEFTNAAILNDTEKNKYVPPSLDMAAINDSLVHDMDALHSTPRGQLSASQKQALDREAVLDVISNKSDPDKLKNLTPKAGENFKPPTATRISQNEVEQALRSRSGNNTPASVKMFTPSKSGMNKMLLEMNQQEEAAIQRETESARNMAIKDMQGKDGKELRRIILPKYEMSERLGCMVENEKPNSILYEELGWDRIPGESTEKHYRTFVAKELEFDQQTMARPSEFQCYEIKRGQSRGGGKSLFSFGGGKKDQETGEEDTTTKMGLFKALITVTNKRTGMDEKQFMLNKLKKIKQLLAEIYVKKNNKPFPVEDGFFCENTLEGSKVMNAAQRERANSDEVQNPDFGKKSAENKKLLEKLSGSGSQSGISSTKSINSTKIDFSDKASTILNQEGRTMFKSLMRQMKLSHLEIMRKVVDVQSDEIIKRLLMSECKCNIRVYVVRAFNLAARDSDSPSDPFVRVILGDVERDNRDDHQTDVSDPDIYQMYEFQAVFPGCPLLKVQFWDYDMLFGDDLIGETIVDLEDRYFSSDFRSVVHKPIEYRKLNHFSTEMSQGTCVMWAEINEAYAGEQAAPLYDISRKPTEDFELRVVVWDTEELEMMDAEGTTDGFIRCFFDSEHQKDTDTHFRNQDGKCSWNYRLLFPFTYPSKNYKMTVQAYDLDLFKSNDLIGQTVLNLEPMFDDAEIAKRGMSLTKEYYDQYLNPEGLMSDIEFDSEDPRQFWVKLMTKEDGKLVQKGKLKMSIDLLSKKDALLNPVGEAQSEPNLNPHLPKPFGRIEFSLNPFKMLSQLIGPALRRKIYCWCCIAAYCALCIMMAPMIISNLFVGMITPG